MIEDKDAGKVCHLKKCATEFKHTVGRSKFNPMH